MCVIPPSLTHPVLPSFLLFLVPSCLQSLSLFPFFSYLPCVLLFFVSSFPIVPASYSVPSFVWVVEGSLSQAFVAPFTFSHFVLLRSSVPAFSFFSFRHCFVCLLVFLFSFSLLWSSFNSLCYSAARTPLGCGDGVRCECACVRVCVYVCECLWVCRRGCV